MADRGLFPRRCSHSAEQVRVVKPETPAETPTRITAIAEETPTDPEPAAEPLKAATAGAAAEAVRFLAEEQE